MILNFFFSRIKNSQSSSDDVFHSINIKCVEIEERVRDDAWRSLQNKCDCDIRVSVQKLIKFSFWRFSHVWSWSYLPPGLGRDFEYPQSFRTEAWGFSFKSIFRTMIIIFLSFQLWNLLWVFVSVRSCYLGRGYFSNSFHCLFLPISCKTISSKYQKKFAWRVKFDSLRLNL